MRFSLNFIKEFLDVKVCPRELASLLTMAGLEVEQLQEKEGDWIFDLEVTSNRYDWLSILGIAREVAVVLGRRLKVKYPKVVRRPLLKDKLIKIENRQDCPFYIGSLIKGVKVTDSPSWLKEKVLNCGISSVNNIIDITNYCMLKWGNPFHAFDEDKIEGNIYIRRAEKGEVFVGIDCKRRILQTENLVIADDKKVIALAGIMGGKNSEVDQSTRNIFLEAAIFSPLAIRRSVGTIGLETESSYRFQRRVNPDYLKYGVYEACRLIRELRGGILGGYKKVGRFPSIKRKKIVMSFSQLNSFLGRNFPSSKVKKILFNLGFEVQESSPGEILVSVPSFRFDIEREVDIYEEVGRIYGYDKLTPQLPFLPHKKLSFCVEGTKSYEFKNELRKFLILLGLREIISYSIEDKKSLDELGQKNFIDILNPLRKEENVLRPTLLLGMIKNIKYNLNRNRSALRFFEIANIYFKDKEVFREIPSLSLGVTGLNNFFYLKGVVDEILKYLNVGSFELKEASYNNFTNALEVIINKKTVGFLGKLNRRLEKIFDLTEDLFFAQVDINLLQAAKRDKVYKPFSLYPPISRDISIALEREVKFKEVENIIKENVKDYLVNWHIIDIYKGKIDKGLYAFTLRIFYQSQEKTLTAQEVDRLHYIIRENLSRKQGVILR